MVKINGLAASPGIAAGKAFLYLDDNFPEIKQIPLNKDNIEHELERLNMAHKAAKSELEAIHKKALEEAGEQAEIFMAHISMLDDPEIKEQVVHRIKNSLENAEWVIWDIYQTLLKMMLESPDPMFRERAADINEISRRLLNKLFNIERKTLAELDSDVIIAANDLLPSEILAMNRKHVKGLVINQGGLTSHTAILARAFNIPAVMGLSSSVSEIQNNDDLIVDGSKGEVIINPDRANIKKYYEISLKFSKDLEEMEKIKNLPAQTKDGMTFVLKANIEIPDEVEKALYFGAEGIGLYRSEFLFLSGANAEEEFQYNAYSRVIKAMGELPVTIRTMDLGGDKGTADLNFTDEKNPLLGWRGIRFSLAQPEFFKTQLRALLRAGKVNGKNNNVKIMFPLVSGIEELNSALILLEEAKAECKKNGHDYSENIETGIMIEVPAAAMISDVLAEKSSFFSIGTNDLLQYSIAIDRDNEKVNYLAEPLHPAIIRLLKMTIDAAHKRGIKTAMCGEMAGDPDLTALLLGMGLDEFSMNAASIPSIKNNIRRLEMQSCKDLAANIIAGKSTKENFSINEAWLREKGLK